MLQNRHPPPTPTNKTPPTYQSYSAHIDASHIEGGGVGYSQGYTSGKVFAGGWGGNTFAFFDGRQHVFNTSKVAGNFGLGARYLTSSGTIFGANSFFDYRHKGITYYQVGGGLEVRSCYIDFTTNGYWVVGRRSTERRKKTFTYPGGFVASCAEKAVALPGWDAEIASGLRKIYPCQDWDVIGGVGPYYYYDRGCENPFWGGKARLALQFPKYLTIEGLVHFDRVFGTRPQGLVTLSFPLGKDPKQCGPRCGTGPLREIAMQPVERAEIIVLDKKFCKRCDNFASIHESATPSVIPNPPRSRK